MAILEEISLVGKNMKSLRKNIDILVPEIQDPPKS